MLRHPQTCPQLLRQRAVAALAPRAPGVAGAKRSRASLCAVACRGAVSSPFAIGLEPRRVTLQPITRGPRGRRLVTTRAVFEKFSERSIKSVMIAQQQAKELGATEVGALLLAPGYDAAIPSAFCRRLVGALPGRAGFMMVRTQCVSPLQGCWRPRAPATEAVTQLPHRPLTSRRPRRFGASSPTGGRRARRRRQPPAAPARPSPPPAPSCTPTGHHRARADWAGRGGRRLQARIPQQRPHSRGAAPACCARHTHRSPAGRASGALGPATPSTLHLALTADGRAAPPRRPQRARAAVEAITGRRRSAVAADNITFSREVKKTFEAATNVSCGSLCAAGRRWACTDTTHEAPTQPAARRRKANTLGS